MSDDLIKKSDVYKVVDDWLKGKVPNLNIKDIPSVDRPQGEWHNGFYDFLWNVINPNEMQKYIEMYEAQPIAVDGAQMMSIEDNKEAYQMVKNTLGSIENRFREAYNKGYKDGIKEGINQAMMKLADSILNEIEDGEREGE